MSFILDAIKKSEDERQRSKQPDIYSLQNSGAASATPQGKAMRLLALFVALAILVAIMAWLWPQLRAQFMQAQPDTAVPAGQVAGPIGVPAAATTNNTQLAGVADSPGAVTQPAAAGMASAALPPAEPVLQASTPPSAQAGSAASSDATLPPRHLIKELWEMPADYQSTVPDLKFSFHVFSNNPDKRTIIINGRRMREGQMVTSRIKLRVITETGVICHYNGRFFHVDVVEGW